MSSDGLKPFVWEYEENPVLQEKPLLVAVRIDQERSIYTFAQQHHTLLCSHRPGSTDLTTSASGGAIPRNPSIRKVHHDHFLQVWCQNDSLTQPQVKSTVTDWGIP